MGESKEGTNQNVLSPFAFKSKPESGLDCLISATFARQRQPRYPDVSDEEGADESEQPFGRTT